MDGHVKRFTKTFSFKTPIIKVNSIPVRRDNGNEEDEHTPLAQAPPPSSSKASSLTVVEKDVYNLEPIVHTHGWKPETMQSPVLVSLALASLLIAALLEILAQKSAVEGALSIVSTADDIPGLVSFGYLYLPTIVAVLYSLAWNWVDLDVKRMQPWLELSREGGATGRDSLFLDYPVDFVAFVPFKAAKRRHWAVFYSGTIVVLVFWLLTPMQGAVFGTAPVLSRHLVNMSYTLDLVDASKQPAMLDQSVLNAGYAVTWLNQAFPPYTTPDYVLKPFLPLALSATAANWTGNTTKYWTELDCWPAKITHVPKKPPGVADFEDGRGCNASALELHSGRPGKDPYKMVYVGYQGDAWADYALRCPTCGPAAWNEFLASMAVWDNSTGTVDFTSAFCETRYWKQNVTATLSRSSRRPVEESVRPLGAAVPLRDAEFNTSAFQFLLTAGVSSVDKPRDFPFTSLLEHYSRLQTAGLQYPLSPMVGFAMGGQNHTADQYTNMTILTSAFAAAHKMLFAVAYSRLLVNTTVATRPGEVFVAQYGVVVSRTFSALVEGCLLLVAVMSALLLWTCRRDRCMLSEDPASMDSLVRLVQSNGEMQALFSGTGHMSDEELRRTLGGYRFQLRCGCLEERGRPRLAVAGHPDYDDDNNGAESDLLEKGPAQVGYLAPVKPLMLRAWAGCVFVLVLGGVTSFLVYLKQTDVAFGGLSRPSSNFEINLILTSYLPTAFSTLVEPLWVLLNRFYCMLQPFYDLITVRDRSTTNRAMKSRYNALPPQLVFLRALKSRHFLLGAVCVTALLGNVLAVGLGALFNELPKSVTYAREFGAPRRPTISLAMNEFLRKIALNMPARYDDPYYVVMANMSYGTALPPWTTSEFSFLPLTIPDAASDGPDAGLYTAETTGFGVDPGCRAVGVLESTSNVPAQIRVDVPPETLTRSNCSRAYTPVSLFLNNTNYAMPDGPVAAEVVDTLTDGYDAGGCDETLILGWARADLRNRTGTIRTSMVTCSPWLRTARFRVSFDAAGYVRAAAPLTAFAPSWPYQNASAAGQPILAAIHYKLRNRQLPWHNDTVSRDWLNYLVKVHAGPGGEEGGALLDPRAALPHPADMVGPVSAVYKMVFAALMSLNPDIYAAADAGATQSGTQVVQETRVFMSTSAFVVCMVILGIYILMALVYYSVAVKLFLPRMPSTVGSLLSYLAPSGIATEKSAYCRGQSTALHFGRYAGPDGRAQIGIDTVDKIVPLDMKRLGNGDTRPPRFRFLRLGRSSKRASTWL